jgi:hypothetical protein
MTTVKAKKESVDISTLENASIERLAHILHCLLFPSESNLTIPDNWDDLDQDETASYVASLFPEIKNYVNDEEIHLIVFYVFCKSLENQNHDYAPIFRSIVDQIELGVTISDTIENWIKEVVSVMSVDSRSDNIPTFPIKKWMEQGGYTVKSIKQSHAHHYTQNEHTHNTHLKSYNEYEEYYKKGNTTYNPIKNEYITHQNYSIL